MRYSSIAVIFTVMLMILPGLPRAAEHVIDDSKEPSYLFVLSAASGSIDGDTLTLNKVPNVVYLTDRPVRKAGHLSLEKFLDKWNKASGNFTSDPPNATLSVLNKNGNKNAVIELLSLEQKNGELNIKVKVLDGKIPEAFEASSLFIDPMDEEGDYTLWKAWGASVTL